MNKPLFFFVTALFFSAYVISTAVAQTTPASTTPASTTSAVTPVTVAEVNIQGSKLQDQVQHIFNISFSLTNGKGIQRDVRYGVRLMEKGTTGYSTIDENIYEEVLTLSENSTTPKNIVYTAPKVLSGTYTLFVVAENSTGLPLGIASVGDVTLKPTASGIEILSKTCTVQNGSGVQQNMGATILVPSSNEVLLTCTVFNQTKGDLSISPLFVTKALSSFGEIVSGMQKVDATPVQIKAGKKESVTFTLPKAQAPKTYHTTLTLSYGEPSALMQSNTVGVSYRISGMSGTIINATLDRDSYFKGDTAVLSLLWNASEAPNAVVDVSIANEKGDICAETKGQALMPGKSDISLSIMENCMNANVSVVLKSANGDTLDQKSFGMNQSVDVPMKKHPFGVGTILLIVGVVLLSIVLSKMFRRKQVDTLIPALIIGGAIALTPFASTQATTYTAGTNNDVFVNVNIDKPVPQTYTPAQNIRVTGSVSVHPSATDSYDISLGAVTIGNSSVNLYSSPSITLAPGATATGIPRILTAPSTPGTYDVAFSADVITSGGPSGMYGLSINTSMNYLANFVEQTTSNFYRTNATTRVVTGGVPQGAYQFTGISTEYGEPGQLCTNGNPPDISVPPGTGFTLGPNPPELPSFSVSVTCQNPN